MVSCDASHAYTKSPETHSTSELMLLYECDTKIHRERWTADWIFEKHTMSLMAVLMVTFPYKFVKRKHFVIPSSSWYAGNFQTIHNKPVYKLMKNNVKMRYLNAPQIFRFRFQICRFQPTHDDVILQWHEISAIRAYTFIVGHRSNGPKHVLCAECVMWLIQDQHTNTYKYIHVKLWTHCYLLCKSS